MSDFQLRTLEQELTLDPQNYHLFLEYQQALSRARLLSSGSHGLTPLEQKWDQAIRSFPNPPISIGGVEAEEIVDWATGETPSYSWRWFLLHQWDLYNFINEQKWNFLERIFTLNPSQRYYSSEDIDDLEHLFYAARKKYLTAETPVIKPNKQWPQEKLSASILDYHYYVPTRHQNFTALRIAGGLQDQQNIHIFRTSEGYILQWTAIYNVNYRREINQYILEKRCGSPSCSKITHPSHECFQCTFKRLQEPPTILTDGVRAGDIEDAVANYQIMFWQYPGYL